MACRPALIWGGILAAGVVAEMHALACHHHDCTLSALTREVFRTDRPAGRIAFIAGSALLALWFQHHIITWKRELDANEATVVVLADRRKVRPAPRPMASA